MGDNDKESSSTSAVDDILAAGIEEVVIDEPFQLLELPEQIRSYVLYYLTLQDRHTVRLVNKTLKNWIDTSNLVQFNIRLRNTTVNTVLNLTVQDPVKKLTVHYYNLDRESLLKKQKALKVVPDSTDQVPDEEVVPKEAELEYPRTQQLVIWNENSTKNILELLTHCSTTDTPTLRMSQESLKDVNPKQLPRMVKILKDWTTLTQLELAITVHAIVPDKLKASLTNWDLCGLCDAKGNVINENLIKPVDDFIRHTENVTKLLNQLILPSVQVFVMEMNICKTREEEPIELKKAVKKFVVEHRGLLKQLKLVYDGSAIGDFEGDSKEESIVLHRMDNLQVLDLFLETHFEEDRRILFSLAQEATKLRRLSLNFKRPLLCRCGRIGGREEGRQELIICDVPVDFTTSKPFVQFLQNNCETLEYLTLQIPHLNITEFPMFPKLVHLHFGELPAVWKITEKKFHKKVPQKIFPNVEKISIAMNYDWLKNTQPLLEIMEFIEKEFPKLVELEIPYLQKMKIYDVKTFLAKTKLTTLSFTEVTEMCPGRLLFKYLCKKTPGLSLKWIPTHTKEKKASTAMIFIDRKKFVVDVQK